MKIGNRHILQYFFNCRCCKKNSVKWSWKVRLLCIGQFNEHILSFSSKDTYFYNHTIAFFKEMIWNAIEFYDKKCVQSQMYDRIFFLTPPVHCLKREQSPNTSSYQNPCTCNKNTFTGFMTSCFSQKTGALFFKQKLDTRVFGKWWSPIITENLRLHMRGPKLTCNTWTHMQCHVMWCTMLNDENMRIQNEDIFLQYNARFYVKQLSFQIFAKIWPISGFKTLVVSSKAFLWSNWRAFEYQTTIKTIYTCSVYGPPGTMFYCSYLQVALNGTGAINKHILSSMSKSKFSVVIWPILY